MREAFAERIRTSSKAAEIVGVSTPRLSKEASLVVADHLIDYVKKGDKLMPDALALRQDSSNEFSSYTLEELDKLKPNHLDREDLLKVIAALKDIAYFWKLARSI